MTDFIDLPGASGATYRFRISPLSPAAGNFAVVRRGKGGLQIFGVGVAADLSRIRDVAADVGDGTGELFTRLNIKRELRDAEHADLMATGVAEIDGAR